MDQKAIDYLKNTYPEEINKDQFYRICHISKKTASYLLKSGLVPCRSTGKKTRQYSIYLSDVIQYLEDREKDSAYFKPPENYYKGYYSPNQVRRNLILNEENRLSLRHFFERELQDYDDVLIPDDISSFLGYSVKSITDWCTKGELKSFLIYNRLKVPKEYLIDFMITDRCLCIAKKSKKHIEMLNEAFSIL